MPLLCRLGIHRPHRIQNNGGYGYVECFCLRCGYHWTWWYYDL
mgnify:CR=1 FL=1